MSTPQLLQILSFENLGPGASASLPHNINFNGVPQRPDIAMCSVAGVKLTVSKTTVTALNVTGENITQAFVWLKLEHSIDRELGTLFGDPWASLDPRPFVPASSDDRGPFMEANVDAAAIDARTLNVTSITHTPGSGVYLLNLTVPVPTGVAVAVTTLGLNTTAPGLIAYEWVDPSTLRVRTWDFGDGIQPADLAFSVSVGLTIKN